MKTALSQADIDQLFHALSTELEKKNVIGELHVVGGAVMCLVFDARGSTADVDAFFQPTQQIREAALRVARNMQMPEHWLNDGVKGFLSTAGEYAPYLELGHLKVMTANPEYMLAMKCLAMRLGLEFHDLDDVRYLLRYLNISVYEDAVEIITRYYPLARFPQKTLYALQELLP